MSDRYAINKMADSLSATALYSLNKNERLVAIRGLARIVRESKKAADTLSEIANYGLDAELKSAALAALAGELY